MRNLLFIGLSLMLCAATAAASSMGATTSHYSGTPEARAAVKAGDNALQSGKSDLAIKQYKKAISLDPNYVEAQQKYTFNRAGEYFLNLLNNHVKLTPKIMEDVNKRQEIISKDMISEYESLAKRYPDSAIYPWVLGQLYDETDLARQEYYCRKSVRIDPNFASGWKCLSHIARLRTKDEKALVYLRRAMKILPDSEDIASSYANILLSDGKAHKAEIRDLLQRFPKSGGIGYALVQSANKSKSMAARVVALERLREEAPKSNKMISRWTARSLYSIYMIDDDLTRAKALAHDMAGAKKENKQWVSRETFVDGLTKAQHAIAAGQAQTALASLKSIKGQGDMLSAQVRWSLMEAKALDADGQTAEAIAKLRDRFVSSPHDVIYEAMVTYGAKMGQSEADINDALWAALRSQAKPAHPFTLKRLDNKQSISLSDYRGKVVIADFWYPNCGPCRASFPYLDEVAVKFQDKGLTVLAINGIQKQQPFALPYLRGMGYHFIGLAGNREFAHKAYGILSFPTTFFIGPKGNILFKIHLSDDASERSAEAAVKFMLTRAKQV